jgi:hypothetical protein
MEYERRKGVVWLSERSGARRLAGGTEVRIEFGSV